MKLQSKLKCRNCGQAFTPKHPEQRECSEFCRCAILGIAVGTCEGCYEYPCVCKPDDCNCDPE